MATTGADAAISWHRWGPSLLLGALTGCVSGSVPPAPPAPPAPAPSARPAPPGPAPFTVAGGPDVRVGLVTGSAAVRIGGSDALVVNQLDGSRITTVPAGETWQVSSAGRQLVVQSPRGWISEALDAVAFAAADPAAPVRIGGRPYRGVAEVFRDSSGLTVVNRVGMEAYLLGVVSAEMGRRSYAEKEALAAQAVVSRTYALRNLGRWRSRGFDLTAGVSDQVYAGGAAETPEGRAAVNETRGQVLTYDGAPIEAFFYSTCGGRTADGFEVFRGAARPYLRSVADRAENGAAYCSISPRYRWHEEWTGATLQTTLARNLPPAAGRRMNDGTEVRDIRVARRSSSGRVDELAIAIGGGPEITISGLAIRRVLRPSSGELLRSNAFTLSAVGGGARVTHLTADGSGSGHGVGFCQWGAVGRARAGQGFEQILAAYFPGTRVSRRY